MSDKPWHELTKEDIGFRPLRENELTKEVGEDDRKRTIPMPCSQTVYSGRGLYSCGSDAKWVREEDRFGRKRKEFHCANHAAGALRSAKHNAKTNEESATAAQDEELARQRLEDIEDTLGIEVDLDYSWTARKYSTTRAVISIDDLERLAEQLADSVPMEQA